MGDDLDNTQTAQISNPEGHKGCDRTEDRGATLAPSTPRYYIMYRLNRTVCRYKLLYPRNICDGSQQHTYIIMNSLTAATMHHFHVQSYNEDLWGIAIMVWMWDVTHVWDIGVQPNRRLHAPTDIAYRTSTQTAQNRQTYWDEQTTAKSEIWRLYSPRTSCQEQAEAMTGIVHDIK